MSFRLLLVGIAALLGASAAQAGVADHENPPEDAVLFLHLAGEDRLPMQPMEPQAYKLMDAAPLGPPECGTALTWTAMFTRVPVADEVTWTRGLGRDAEFGDARPQLTWYVETVEPGGSQPIAVPATDMRLQAQLRTGDDPEAAGQGRLLAQGTFEGKPSAAQVEGRGVHKFDVRLAWNNQTVLASEGMHLLISLDTGHEDCRFAPPGLRAYGSSGHRPHLRLTVYEPVFIDLLEPRLDGDDWTIVWHASSPWGRFDLIEPAAPLVRGPLGDAPRPELVETGDGPILETLWAWDPAGAPNGTYRVDVAIQNTAGIEAVANSVFHVGSDEPGDEPAPAASPGKKSPAPAVPLALVAALALARVSRR